MTVREVSRCCLFGAVLGGGAAWLIHSICRIVGFNAPLPLEIAVVVLGAILWTAYKTLQQRVLQKDYEKMVNERRRRMR